MKIITVCGMGMGSSLILKMTIDSVLQKEGIKDVWIEHSDLGMAKALEPDLFAVSCDMQEIFEEMGKKFVAVTSVFDENAVRESVLPAVKEFLGMEG